jgi:hypothetical protein
MESDNSLKILPFELWVIILSFLDPVYLHAVKFVCHQFKEWSGKPLGNPLLQAIKDKNKEMIQWCIDQKFIATKQEFIELAKQGDLENIKLLNGSLQDFNAHVIEICEIAAQYGHLHILQFFGSSKIWQKKYLQKKASLNGHLHILEYIYELNPEYLNIEAIFRSALDGSQLHIYKWICKLSNEPIQVTGIYGLCKKCDLEFIKEIGPEKIKNKFIGSYAAQSPEIMEWLHENGILKKCYYACITSQGSLEMIEWFKDLGYELGEDEFESIAQEAARGGYLHILEWVNRNYKIQNYSDLVTNALVNGHLNILKWIDGKNMDSFNFDLNYLDCPAQASLEFLNWFDEKGLKFSDESCLVAIASNNLVNLEWFYTHGYSLNEKAYNIATLEGYLHIIHWLRKHNIPFNLDEIALRAAGIGQLHILEWVKDIAKETNKPLPNTIMNEASRHLQIHILKWGILNGMTIPNNIERSLPLQERQIINKWKKLYKIV